MTLSFVVSRTTLIYEENYVYMYIHIHMNMGRNDENNWEYITQSVQESEDLVCDTSVVWELYPDAEIL